MSLFLDATAIDTWLQCRESYRQRYLENRVTAEPQIQLSFGAAVHKAVEYWHRGTEYRDCLKVAAEEMEAVPEERFSVPDQLKWRELGLALPECVAVYCDGVAPEPRAEIELEWARPFVLEDPSSPYLCGKIDRYGKGILTDVKTASEIGRTWRADYRSTLLRTFQFGLYDWYLRSRGRTSEASPREAVQGPVAVRVECIVKPYRGKAARLEIFDLPEILVYRKRFDQQLAWVVREIVAYHEKYAGVQPWPMASSQTCQGKFSACPYLKGCNMGWTPKVLESYKTRDEHLELLKVLK